MEIQLRITNLEDRFDGKNNSQTYYFDVNNFAREYFMEANAHWLSKNLEEAEKTLEILTVNIKEMNAAGSIQLTKLDDQTHWKTDEKSDPKGELDFKPP